MKVTKSFTFDAAHFLTQYHGVCERLHGHTYRLDVTVEGKVDKQGMVVDFLLLKYVVQKHVIAHADHRCLNDFLKNPSAENVAIWAWAQLKDLRKHLQDAIKNVSFDRYVAKGTVHVPKISSRIRLHEIRVWETSTSCVAYNGGDRFSK